MTLLSALRRAVWVLDRYTGRPVLRATAIGVSLVVIALTVMAGGLAAVVTLLVAVAVTQFVAAKVALPLDRRFVMIVVGVVLLGRCMAAAVIQLALGPDTLATLLAPDAVSYNFMAEEQARSWHGEPTGAGFAEVRDNANIITSYVKASAVLFWLVGTEPVVLKFADTALSVLMALLAYRTLANLGASCARWALLVLVLYPSLMLWSVLALKDSYVLFFMMAAVWATSEFLTSKNLAWWIATVISMLAIENSRRFLFVLLVVLWPVSIALFKPRRWSIPASLGSAGVAVFLLLVTPSSSYFSEAIVKAPAFVRSAMTQGARSAIEAAVATPVPAPTRSAVPTVTSAAPTIAPTAQTTAAPSGVPTTGPSATAAPPVAVVIPSPEPPPLVIIPQPAAPPVPTVIEEISGNLRYLPTGFLYLVAAPFPWAARTPIEFLTVPEMLLWYGSVVAGLAGLLRVLRERRWAYAYVVLLSGALVLVLSLSEGNVGTLVRHRAMLILFIVMLGTVGWPDLARIGARAREATSRLTTSHRSRPAR